MQTMIDPFPVHAAVHIPALLAAVQSHALDFKGGGEKDVCHYPRRTDGH